MGSWFGKVWQFFKWLNKELSYDLAIPLLGIDPREIKGYVHTKNCNMGWEVGRRFSREGTNVMPMTVSCWCMAETNTIISVQFICSVVSSSLRPHEPQHARSPCPSPISGVHPNPCTSSRWCHPTISSSVIPFSSCPQSFPAPGYFQMSQLFTSGGQSTGVSASTSVLPMNTQDGSLLGWTGWISLQSKGLPRVFSNATVQKHQFFCAQLSL